VLYSSVHGDSNSNWNSVGYLNPNKQYNIGLNAHLTVTPCSILEVLNTERWHGTYAHSLSFQFRHCESVITMICHTNATSRWLTMSTTCTGRASKHAQSSSKTAPSQPSTVPHGTPRSNVPTGLPLPEAFMRNVVRQRLMVVFATEFMTVAVRRDVVATWYSYDVGDAATATNTTAKGPPSLGCRRPYNGQTAVDNSTFQMARHASSSESCVVTVLVAPQFTHSATSLQQRLCTTGISTVGL